MEAMRTTITFNFSITVNPIPFFINLVLIYSYVAEEGRHHDNIANPVNGSVWRGFEMFRVVMFVAATALVAILALLLHVIPKGRSSCSLIANGTSVPSDNSARSYQNSGTQMLNGAINTTGDIKGTGSGSFFYIRKLVLRNWKRSCSV